MRVFVILLFIPLCSAGQKKSYAFIQPALFMAENYENKFHVNVGGGYSPVKWLGIGAAIDAFVFRKEMRFWVPKLDLRYFLPAGNEAARPFLAIQPGKLLYNYSQDDLTIKGDFALDILAGIQFKNPGRNASPGMTFAIGYARHSLKYYNRKVPYKGFKIQAGILF